MLFRSLLWGKADFAESQPQQEQVLPVGRSDGEASGLSWRLPVGRSGREGSGLSQGMGWGQRSWWHLTVDLRVLMSGLWASLLRTG